MEEKIKACYLAFLQTANISSCKAALVRLRRLSSDTRLARNLRQNIKIENVKFIFEAEDLIRRYHDYNVYDQYK